ncbi:MAG: FAD-binding oxidoreductase [Pseudomonadota bacterium]
MSNHLSQIESKLIDALGVDAVMVGPDVSDRYAVDWGGESPCLPPMVVKPADTEAVSRVLKLCHEMNQPVVVQGGLTGLSGGSTPQENEVAVSLERMTGIEELDSASMTMTVLAGTPLQKVQDAAADAGFAFPLDLGARGSCAIGGNVATNAGGNQVIRYGMTRALVLGLEAVLADGTVVTSLNKMLKNNAGYDLKHLFIGTEGTLGIITRIVLKLFPQMKSRNSGLLAVSGFDQVVELLKFCSQSFVGAVSSFEVMWDNYFDVALKQVRDGQSPFDESHPFYVLLEVEGADQSQDSERFEQALFAAMEQGLVVDAIIAQSEKESESFWEIRDAIGEILSTLGALANFDVGLPVSKMNGFLAETEKRLRNKFDPLILMVFGHLGDGNLHMVASTGDQAAVNEIYRSVYEVVGEYGGSVTAEHGIGTMKIPYLHYSRSHAEIQLMKTLKATLDPKGILNPRRVLP